MPDKNPKRPPLSRASLLRVRPPHRPKRPRCHCVLTGRSQKRNGPPFGDETTVFDWATYEQAKPHFRKVFEEFRASGKSLQEFATFLIRNFSEKIRPYLKHFLKEVQAGKLYEQPLDQVHRRPTSVDEMSEGLPADQFQDRPQLPRDPNRPPLVPGQTELTQEQKDYFLGQVKTLDTLQRLTKKFNLLDVKERSHMPEHQVAAPARTWPNPRIDPNRPPLLPGQTELTEEQKQYLRGRLKTLAQLQRLTKKFKLDGQQQG